MSAAMQLYGTVTSPYVRRVRVVAHELALRCDLVDVATDDGQAALRTVNPLWKIPTAVVDGDVLFDSRVIVDVLVERHGGPAGLALRPPADVATRNTITVIDGVLDALINVFYLDKDGVQAESSSYLRKQHDRVRASMVWLEGRVQDGWLSPERHFGLAELALTTTLGWMRFRETYPIDDHPALVACVQRHDARESLLATRPFVA